jgi:hypothetical protein
MAFSDQLRDMVNKGMAASHDMVTKAATQAQAWGEMGVLKVEIIQLHGQAEKLTAKLGAEAYAAFVERKEQNLSAELPVVKDLISRIATLSRQIEDKEETFSRLGGKKADLY